MPVTFLAIQRVLGYLVMLFSLTMLSPIPFSLYFGDGTWAAFAGSFLVILGSGAAIWYPVRNEERELRLRDGFLVVALFWVVLGLFGAAPLLLSEVPSMRFTDAVFESVSGLTTTGATVLAGLDSLLKAILFYRQQLQWLGGLGIIVLAVAVLPMLGVGGMQLYRAETPGPSKDSKLTPRITETAKALATVYVALTMACAGAYYAVGMSGFDAIAHAFSTVAIGGFSTHDASIGYFQNDGVLLVCSIFMCISAINFGLHFVAWHRKTVSIYRKDSETRFFLSVLGVCIAITCAYLLITKTLQPGESITHGIFQAISITTTTGFATKDFAAWPTFLPVMLLMFSFMGGCVGSTGGGMKAMRLMLIYKQGARELKQLVHPNAVIPLKVGRTRVEATVVSAVWSFFAVYTTSFIIIMLLLMATGLDFTTAFSAVAASLNNLGPGLGEVAANYSSINEVAKGLLCFTMVLGRLEVFTLLVLFTPMFWRI